MVIGIIGAGKVGCSLGRYLSDNHVKVAGFYDADSKSAEEAAEFSNVRAYSEAAELVHDSDTLFLTVPDGLITTVWSEIRELPVEGKYICHCSGALSAGEAFPGITERGAFGYSIHPLFAVSDKFHSCKELSHAYFTIEGDQTHLQEISSIFENAGNPVRHIKAEDKTRYHLAAAIVSNHVLGVLSSGFELMQQCGFDESSAREALAPLIMGNVSHVLETGAEHSLTGPVERGDVSTVTKHLSCLGEEDRDLYRLISKKLLDIGRKKNPQRDYSVLEDVLNQKNGTSEPARSLSER